MRINIAASHRFHLLDLARELSLLGHDVKFYSYVPADRVVSFGLDKKSVKSLFYFMLPFLGLIKIFKESFWAIKLCNLVMDELVARFMAPCDVFIGLGTVYEKSFLVAKEKYNANTIVEWGSKHILSQQDILKKLPNYKKQPQYFIDRAINSYKIADYISVASDHVKESFLDHGVPEKKIIKNPYGVDLSMFGPTQLDSEDVFDIIMVGGWSYRKGCDLIIELCEKYKYRFLHVGPLVDIKFPTIYNMVHVDSVNQKELLKFYKKARVFVLPSREEGLAMVQSQALACGLPIVCSKNTGGRDLRSFLSDGNYILEMQEYSLESLNYCVVAALNLSKKQTGYRTYSEEVIQKLTWGMYASRYVGLINKTSLYEQ